MFGKKENQAMGTLKGRERLLQNRVLVPNWLFFDDVSSISYDDWTKKYTNIVSFFLCSPLFLLYSYILIISYLRFPLYSFLSQLMMSWVNFFFPFPFATNGFLCLLLSEILFWFILEEFTRFLFKFRIFSHKKPFIHLCILRY